MRKNSVSVLAAVAAMVCGSVSMSHGVMLAGYDLLSVANGGTGNIASTGATSLDAGVASSTLSRGAGFGNNSLGGFTGRGAFNTQNGGGTFSTPSTLTAAMVGNHYAQVDVSPVSGNALSLSSLEVAVYQQNQHPGATVYVHYSLDAFATSNVLLTTINPVSHGWSGALATVNLAGEPALQATASAVTFRFYFVGFGGWEDRGIGQIAGNNVDLAINGSSAPIPEPAALGLLAPAALALSRRRR
jgi:hypothetical protein